MALDAAGEPALEAKHRRREAVQEEPHRTRRAAGRQSCRALRIRTREAHVDQLRQHGGPTSQNEVEGGPRLNPVACQSQCTLKKPATVEPPQLIARMKAHHTLDRGQDIVQRGRG